jgi:hypothetical protein
MASINTPKLAARKSAYPHWDIDVLQAVLVANVRELTETLLGDPNPQLSSNKEIRFGSKDSLCVPLTGKYAGCWNNFETGEKGSLIQLIQSTNRSTLKDSLAYAANLFGARSNRR